MADAALSRSSARNRQTGDMVAIKKVTKIFSKKILAKRALRELKFVDMHSPNSADPPQAAAPLSRSQERAYKDQSMTVTP